MQFKKNSLDYQKLICPSIFPSSQKNKKAYDLRIRNFQPSRSPFSIQPSGQAIHNHLSYSSYLKQIEDPKEKRIIPSIRRNVVGEIDKNLGAGDVTGDERMVVFIDLKV